MHVGKLLGSQLGTCLEFPNVAIWKSFQLLFEDISLSLCNWINCFKDIYINFWGAWRGSERSLIDISVLQVHNLHKVSKSKQVNLGLQVFLPVKIGEEVIDDGLLRRCENILVLFFCGEHYTEGGKLAWLVISYVFGFVNDLHFNIESFVVNLMLGWVVEIDALSVVHCRTSCEFSFVPLRRENIWFGLECHFKSCLLLIPSHGATYLVCINGG